MKRSLLITISFLYVALGATAQVVTIPDANFKNYLVNNPSINTNNDTEIQLSEATAFTGTINCQNLNISDLTGIEAFTALTKLLCGNNPLGTLDVSQNIALEMFQPHNNNLSSLDVSNNTALLNLVCVNNNLSVLDLSQNTNIYLLSCGGNNLSSLDVSQLNNLAVLACPNNNLTALDLSQNTDLDNFSCVGNNLASLNMKNINTGSMSYFDASSNPNLSCIEVDDVAVATAALTNIDPQTSFNTSCSPIVNIPDANFKNYLVSNSSINTNMDAEIQLSEAIAFTGTISCANKSIADLTGIEDFVNLTKLNCNFNNISSLNVEQNTALTELYLSGNDVSSLNVSQNTALIILNFQNNDVSSIDVSQNTSLETLFCNYNNLSDIDLSNNPALTKLYCNGNNDLTTLDLSQNPNLEVLFCGDNSGLTSLDLSNNPALLTLHAEFASGIGNISTIDLSQNINLEQILCRASGLTAIDVSQNAALEFLDCSENHLSALDVSQNAVLTNLKCRDNNLSTLDISQNTALRSIECSNNTIITLDVSQNASLEYLVCNNNNLTHINLGQVTTLKQLQCFNNDLTAIDVSQNTVLSRLLCHNNMLTSLRMKGVSTSTLSSNNFKAQGNADLSCIEVDDAAAATAAWTNIGSQTSFSEDCGYIILVSAISVQGQGGTSTIATLGGSLQMEAAVLPIDATDPTYTWSVVNLTGSAEIDANGLLTALTDGVVQVSVTANDGSGVIGTADITISNQTSSTEELSTLPNISIYPNPANAEINIETKANIEAIRMMDALGTTVKKINAPNSTMDISDLAKGIYFLQIQVDENLISKRIIVE